MSQLKILVSKSDSSLIALAMVERQIRTRLKADCFSTFRPIVSRNAQNYKSIIFQTVLSVNKKPPKCIKTIKALFFLPCTCEI